MDTMEVRVCMFECLYMRENPQSLMVKLLSHAVTFCPNVV